MKDEIKEILDELENDYDRDITLGEINLIRDYITNLLGEINLIRDYITNLKEELKLEKSKYKSLLNTTYGIKIHDPNYYLIYGLKEDFTYIEVFDDFLELNSFLKDFVLDDYKNDYKIIKGNLIENEN